MSEGHWIDEVSRILASPVSRRELASVLTRALSMASLMGLGVQRASSQTPPMDQCDTNPAGCKCNIFTCINDCFGLLNFGMCAGSCASCIAAVAKLNPAFRTICGICFTCSPSASKCVSSCTAKPCLCTPCQVISPLNRICFMGNPLAETCTCNGQTTYYALRTPCRTGTTCCTINPTSAACFDLLRDPNHCGTCVKKCAAGVCCKGNCCNANQHCSPQNGCCAPPIGSYMVNAAKTAATVTFIDKSGRALKASCTVTNGTYSCSGQGTSNVTCTVTKSDKKHVTVACTATNDFGCKSDPVDPTVTALQVNTGMWVKQTFTDIPEAESFVTVLNADDGLHRLEIEVNGSRYKTLQLRDRESRTINVASAMMSGDNVITFIGHGDLGDSATVLVGDSQVGTKPNQSQTAEAISATRSPNAIVVRRSRHDPVWGHLSEETESTTHLYVASTNSQTVQLTFSGVLNLSSANDPRTYEVEVNGRVTQVKRVDYDPDRGHLEFQLAPRTLQSGDQITVFWDGLRTAEGRELFGHAGSITATSVQ